MSARGKKFSIDARSEMINIFVDMYEAMGDRIALQYGGSEAHKKFLANLSLGTQKGATNLL